jgi:hypothetical protein
MAEIYYSVYLNKKDGELYAVLDSVKLPPAAEQVLGVPVYSILKDKKLVKTSAPEKLENIKIKLSDKNEHLKLVGSIYKASEDDVPDFHLDSDLPHPMLQHLDEDRPNFFVYQIVDTINHIPYSAICYFTTTYTSGILSSVTFILNNRSSVVLKVKTKDEHLAMIQRLKVYQDWKVKNESEV